MESIYFVNNIGQSLKWVKEKDGYSIQSVGSRWALSLAQHLICRKHEGTIGLVYSMLVTAGFSFWSHVNSYGVGGSQCRSKSQCRCMKTIHFDLV